MSNRSAVPGTFTVERIVKAPPAQVFQAFADPAQKARWFAGPVGWEQHERTMDFRPGGTERVSGRHASGVVSTFDCLYRQIIPGERIIYVYDMALDGKPISVSLATIEFHADGGGTKLVITEQGMFIDGYQDNGSREQGTTFLIDKIAALFA